MASKKKINLGGKLYDPEEVADMRSIQRALVPPNWPGTSRQCVELFLSTQNVIALELKRHLAGNWRQICKANREEADDGGVPKLGISFTFELDQTAPQVVAVTKMKMSFSVKHSTSGAPKVHDINQGEFLDEDMAVVFDTKSLGKESEEAKSAPVETAAAAEGDAPVIDIPGAAEKPVEQPPAENGALAKPKRKRKKPAAS